MDLLPKQQVERQELQVTEEQKVRLVRILMKLSARERQCFLLHTAHGMSLADIAEELKLKKRSVQYYVDNAKSKVAQGL
nr:sigma factor-like helix-turn-helix DNA-binding protein [Cohnella thailandensis]